MAARATTTNESEILAAIAAQDLDRAFRLLMKEYGVAVYSFCCRILADRSMAEDVLQETLTQAFRDLRSWQQQATLRSWLFGIAAHRCQDAIRARGRRLRRFIPHLESIPEPIDVASDPEQRLDGHMHARQLDDCISQMSPEVRMAVLLRFQEGRTFPEIAQICGDKVDTVRARVVRALPALRSCLEQKGVTP